MPSVTAKLGNLSYLHYMTSSEAGKAKALDITSIAAGIALVVFFIPALKGNPGVLILYIISFFYNFPVLIFLAILFSLTCLLEQKAGKAILTDKRPAAAIALKYSLLIILPLLVYIAFINAINNTDNFTGNPVSIYFIYLFQLFTSLWLLVIPAVLAIWLITCRSLDKKNLIRQQLRSVYNILSAGCCTSKNKIYLSSYT